ncbi:hypothetical protein ACFL26_02120 [Patescibacteria group bacterium]
MRTLKLTVALIACGLFAAGCVGDPPTEEDLDGGVPDSSADSGQDPSTDSKQDADEAEDAEPDPSMDSGQDAEVEQDPRETLAICLTESGAVMYGAWWCSACQTQLRMFGPYRDLLNYVDCYPDYGWTESQECLDVGIEAYPTWIFGDGSRGGGSEIPPNLAEEAGCPWTGN